MLSRPILLNRPLKPKRSPVYRPGSKADASRADAAGIAPAAGLKRTARLMDKLEEARCAR